MSKLQSFVNNRNGQADSPQNGQLSVNPARQAIAANARVPMKPQTARPAALKDSYLRGEGVVQHQVVPAPQQHLQQVQGGRSGESRKLDPWDTDGESIDTTINESVVQVEDSQQHEPQQVQPNNEESEAGGDEASDFDGTDDEGTEYGPAVDDYLVQYGFADATEEERSRFLRETQPQLFPVVDGDSYPTTTDGNPTEWDEQQESRYEDLGSPSLSPEGPPQGLDATLSNQQPLRLMPSHVPRANSVEPLNTRLWQQGAQLRGQQRNNSAVQARAQVSQHQNAVHPSASQPPTYSQATDERHLAAPLATHTRVESILQGGQTDVPLRANRTRPNPGPIQNRVPEIIEFAHAFKQTPMTRAQVAPVFQLHVEPTPVINTPAFPEVDYDAEELARMNYNHLRDESFDKNPRERESVLPENMRERPLPERLHFVQHEFDPIKQSEFFSSLPTSQWEAAGDWFLDQFSAIIKKTKEARQKKRNAARGFEEEIEVRHQHVAKKQRLVEVAMAKMQAQGEGLVPKSPRASKSPRPGSD